MNEYMIWELIGYFGSALVLVSLLMSSIYKLRIINALGSLIFCIYAFKINSIPTAIMNICLVGIDLYFLYRLTSAKKPFSSVSAGCADSTVQYILSRFAADITKYFDTTDISQADKVLIVFDNETVAGLFAGVNEGRTLRVILDYSTPQYRDCKVAQYLYTQLAADYEQIEYAGSNPMHIPYCVKMGYVEQNGVYVKKLG